MVKERIDMSETTPSTSTRADQCSTQERAHSVAPWYAESPNRIIQYVSLLYTVFFFVHPYYQHSLRQWIVFALFYSTFLTCYFGIAVAPQKWKRPLLAGFFLLCFAYVPFNPTAAGSLVYPVVFTAFLLREPDGKRALRVFLSILAAQIAAIFLEFYILHLNLGDAEQVTFLARGHRPQQLRLCPAGVQLLPASPGQLRN